MSLKCLDVEEDVPVLLMPGSPALPTCVIAEGET